MDLAYLLWLQGLRQAAPPVVQALFSFLGSNAASVLMLLVPCLAYWCLDKRRGMFALLCYGGSWVCNQLVKNTVCCYRPWVRDARVMPDPAAIAGASGYSFPSGHTQSSASMLVSLGWQWRHRRWPLVAGVALTLLVAFSRNFLGVHTPQDVLVGFAEGCLFVVLTTRLLAWVEAREGRDLRVLALGLTAIVGYLAFVTLKPYPRDYVDGVLLVDPAEMLVDCYKAAGGCAGLLVGWVVERRYVGFATGGLGLGEMAARLLVGALVVLVVYEPLGHALVDMMGAYAGQFARHLLAFFLAVAVVPVSFGPLGRVGARWRARRGSCA